MSHCYPSSREQFARILPVLESARRRTKGGLYDVFCGVLYLLKSGCGECCPVPRLAHLLISGMERAARPRSGFHSGASPKKNRFAARQSNGRKEQTSFCIVEERQEHGHRWTRAMTQARRCCVIAVVAPCIHVTTVTDRGMFDRRRDGLSQVQNVLVDGGYTGKPFATAVQGLLGASVEVVKRSELHTFVVLPKRWVVERSFAWLEKCRRLWKNCERKLNTSLQMVVLAFTVLILKRL